MSSTPEPGRDTLHVVEFSVMICLLGAFRVLKAGAHVPLASGSKTERFLYLLALRCDRRTEREVLLETLWPDSDSVHAGQSLNSLVYSLNKLLGQAVGGAAPILTFDGQYCLNTEAGIQIDTTCFETLARTGDQLARANDLAGAMAHYRQAAAIYKGDLYGSSEVQAILERERLRSRYLMILAHLADDAFRQENYVACLEQVGRLLANDPCREDAHRLMMRCYVRCGERAQALRQYQLCQTILKSEFDAVPENATVALYDQIRQQPSSV